jgi:hypothetical protein
MSRPCPLQTSLLQMYNVVHNLCTARTRNKELKLDTYFGSKSKCQLTVEHICIKPPAGMHTTAHRHQITGINSEKIVISDNLIRNPYL